MRTSLQIEDGAKLSVLNNAKAKRGIKGKLKLFSNNIIKTPILAGLFKTYLLLPEVEMTYRELEVILKHELIHCKRRDLWVKSLALLANAIHWFNPAAYRLTKNMDTFCELSCDEQVVSDMNMKEQQFYGETILNVLCRVVNQHSGVYATLAESKKGIERRLTHMMNVRKSPRRIVLISLITAAILCLSGFAVASIINITEENKIYKDAESLVVNHMKDKIGDDPSMAYHGEYYIDGIEQAGQYTFAVVNHFPNEGQGGMSLFVMESVSGKLTIIDRLAAEKPISFGVAVYKKAFSGVTLLYGVVTDQIWLDLDGAPQKVEFTEVKALYLHGKSQSVKVNNDHTFMICIEGDVYIGDVLFLSGSKVVNKLSAFPMGENVVEDFNTSTQTPPSPAPSEPVGISSTNIQIGPATDELLNEYDSFHEYINDEGGEWVVIWPDTELKEFAFISVNHDATGDELSFLAGDILFSADELSPEKPLIVKLLIPGLVPAYGISFVDENGVERYYTIHLSGKGEEEASPYFLLEFENGNHPF